LYFIKLVSRQKLGPGTQGSKY